MVNKSNLLFFSKLLNLTIISVYFLIAVGGIVRSTGSGMGCPDWPKCFGKWIPPLKASEVPLNYKEIYSAKRKLKNIRISNYLEKLGFVKLAEKINSDPSIYKEVDFNPIKTWIEYLNRVIGVIVGLLIFLLLFYSIKYFSNNIIILSLSISSFILVALEGWLGSIVVSTNLLPFIVTVHMALALILVSLLIFLRIKISVNNDFTLKSVPNLYKYLVVALLITFFQILLGTQVREEIDIVGSLMDYANRNTWIGKLSNIFYFHRSFSIVVLLFNLLIIFIYLKNKVSNSFNVPFALLFSILISEIFVGILLAYFSIPPFLQPIHLILGCCLFGVQNYLLFSNVSVPLNILKV